MNFDDFSESFSGDKIEKLNSLSKKQMLNKEELIQKRNENRQKSVQEKCGELRRMVKSNPMIEFYVDNFDIRVVL